MSLAVESTTARSDAPSPFRSALASEHVNAPAGNGGGTPGPAPPLPSPRRIVTSLPISSFPVASISSRQLATARSDTWSPLKSATAIPAGAWPASNDGPGTNDASVTPAATAPPAETPGRQTNKTAAAPAQIASGDFHSDLPPLLLSRAIRHPSATLPYGVPTRSAEAGQGAADAVEPAVPGQASGWR